MPLADSDLLILVTFGNLEWGAARQIAEHTSCGGGYVGGEKVEKWGGSLERKLRGSGGTASSERIEPKSLQGTIERAGRTQMIRAFVHLLIQQTCTESYSVPDSVSALGLLMGMRAHVCCLLSPEFTECLKSGLSLKVQTCYMYAWMSLLYSELPNLKTILLITVAV